MKLKRQKICKWPTVKRTKNFWLFSPTQLFIHGQWWSIFLIHRRHTLHTETWPQADVAGHCIKQRRFIITCNAIYGLTSPIPINSHVFNHSRDSTWYSDFATSNVNSLCLSEGQKHQICTNIHAISHCSMEPQVQRNSPIGCSYGYNL